MPSSRFVFLKKHNFYGHTTENNFKATSYDQESGQVFSEQVCSGPPRQNWKWSTQDKYKHYESLASSFPRHKVGSSSLRDIAVRCAVLNIRYIDSDCLKATPWRIIKPIWDLLWSRYVHHKLPSEHKERGNVSMQKKN